MFEYELSKVARGIATIRYTNRIIKNGGTCFETYKETEHTQTMQYKTSDIDASHEKWQQANSKVNAALYFQKQALIKSTECIDLIEPEIIDMKDIDELFSVEGRGPHLLEFEFDPVTEEPELYVNSHGEEKQKWLWKHRITGKTFYRHQSSSGKSFDTGRLSKFLQDLRKASNPLAYARAQHVLQLNGSLKQVTNESNQPVVFQLDRKALLHQQVRNPQCVFFNLF
jgi:hypothetical protein